MTNDGTITFSFGKNWEEFVRSSFAEERVAIARQHLLDFLELPDLRGKYFLDVGSGSGIHSLAALQAGAERIVSFDVDPFSVKTTAEIRRRAGEPSNWQVLTGSALDREFLASLEPADVVYSWGVLHHTGRMWEAVENTAALIRPGGVFYLGLYTTTPRCAYWMRVKTKYNRASSIGKRLMEARFTAITLALHSLRLRNPVTLVRGYRSTRGMSFLTDLRDWLGGLPYEHASAREVVHFAVRRNLHVVNIVPGCHAQTVAEYLLRRQA